MRTGVRIMDAMTKKPVCASPDISVQDAAKLMRKRHVGSLLITEKNKLLGVFTEHDIVRMLAIDANIKKAKVSEFMNQKIIAVDPNKDLYETMVLMNKENVRRLPVILNNKCIGIITLKDILKIQPTLLELMVDRIKLRH